MDVWEDESASRPSLADTDASQGLGDRASHASRRRIQVSRWPGNDAQARLAPSIVIPALGDFELL